MFIVTFFCFLFLYAPLSFALSFLFVFGNIQFGIYNGHFATARSDESVPYAQVANADHQLISSARSCVNFSS
jgi:hypothetical protein